jgi:hypothetical protein
MPSICWWEKSKFMDACQNSGVNLEKNVKIVVCNLRKIRILDNPSPLTGSWYKYYNIGSLIDLGSPYIIHKYK